MSWQSALDLGFESDVGVATYYSLPVYIAHCTTTKMGSAPFNYMQSEIDAMD